MSKIEQIEKCRNIASSILDCNYRQNYFFQKSLIKCGFSINHSLQQHTTQISVLLTSLKTITFTWFTEFGLQNRRMTTAEEK